MDVKPMEENVRKLLLGGIDTEDLLGEIALHFYEKIEDADSTCPSFREKMASYSSLNSLFHHPQDAMSTDEAALCEDLFDDIDYELMYQFDVVEDSVKKEMLKGSLASSVQAEMRESGIIPMDGGKAYTADDVEQFYVRAFQDFDKVREALEGKILATSPADFYEEGRHSHEMYRQAHGLQMDERDFNRYYMAHFDKEWLWKIFAQKVYESVHYHRHYVMEYPSDDEEEADHEPAETDGLDEQEEEDPGDEEGFLVPGEDMKPEDFSFIYELMNEYNGSRILPSEQDPSQYDADPQAGAYWQTYGDEFGELLGTYMISRLEDTINYFSTQRPEDYATLAKLYGWSQKDRKDPEVILRTCDKISYFLADLQEDLWSDFMDSPLQPFYEQGRSLSQEGQKKTDAQEAENQLDNISFIDVKS